MTGRDGTLPLSALPWFGGKSCARGQSIGRWVVARLDGRGAGCYVEPFAGMLGVLLGRPAADHEIVNDIDGRVVNWWRVVRDMPHELAEILDWTPDRSRDTLSEAISRLDDPDPVRRAWAFTVAVTNSADPLTGPSFKLTFNNHSPTHRLGVRHRLRPLADRMRLVQIERCDAVGLLERVPAPSPTMRGGTLIYADPPYPGRSGGGYLHDVDHDALDEALVAAAARGIDVACSGYPGDRPALDAAGWSRHEHSTTAHHSVAQGVRPQRIECLWTSWHEDPTPALWPR